MDILKKFLPFLGICFIVVVLFRPYIFQHKVPFPSNLLVSFYQPWASYTQQGYPNGVPNKPMGFDNLRIFYPVRSLTVSQLKKFQWPLWNPYDFSGNTQLATYQSAVFHPFSFLFFILPISDAWSVIILLQPLLAAWFMYLFLQGTGLSKKSSFFGAIVFGFSGFIIVTMEESFMSGYSALFLPLILYAIEKIYNKKSIGNFVLLTIGLLASLVSGWFQMTLYVWVFSFIWSLYCFKKSDRKNKNNLLILTFFAFIFALTFAAIHLLPSIEAYLYSARGTTDAKFLFQTYLVPWYFLITYIAPDFFGNPGSYNYFGSGFFYEKILFVGLPAFLFGIYELFRWFKLVSKEKFFLISWLITLSLGISLPTSWVILYYLHLPFIATVLPSRIFFLSTTCISILAAYGLEQYTKDPDKHAAIRTIIWPSVALLTAWVVDGFLFIYDKHYHLKALVNAMVSLKNLVIPTGLFLILAILFYLGKKDYGSRIFGWVCILVSLISSLYFAQKYLYFSDKSFIFPQNPVITVLQQQIGINRFWSIGKSYINSNFSTYYQIPSFEGYDSIYIQRYGELIYAASNKGIYSAAIPRADASLPNVNSLTELTRQRYSMRLLSLVGAKYIVAPNDPTKNKEDAMHGIFESVWNDNHFILYDNQQALPRVFLADQFIVRTTKQGLLNAIFDPQIQLKDTIIFEKAPSNFVASKGVLNGVVHVDSYQPNTIILHTQSNKTALLFLSDNYFPGWQATIDGKGTPIYRADYTFRTIVVPSGNHKIIFDYYPQTFYAGLYISFGSIVVCIISVFFLRSIYNKKER